MAKVFEVTGRIDAGSMDALADDTLVARDDDELLVLEAAPEGGEA